MTYRYSLLAVGASALALLAGTAQADQVFNDDVIASFSLCVGNDCVNGESFGFDTVRLKENNTRLHFNDTSNSASFPTTDWRLTANESSNGGRNEFTIDNADLGRSPFVVEAGARNNQLVIDDNNRVGFGTDTPVVDLHVKQGNTPTLRLEQDGSSGFSTQTWDLAGNEAGFFLRDASNGSKLNIRVQPNAPSEALFIKTSEFVINEQSDDMNFRMESDSITNALFMEGATGEIGIGTNAPEGILHTVGSGVQLVYFESSDNDAVQVRFRSDSGNRRFLATDSADAVETQIVFGNSSIQLAGPTNSGANLWATIDATGITTQGGTCNVTPCDRTFDPSYFEVPPIAERATYMWENMHLPAVGPTKADAPINITEKTTGMLHELEIAHIYIEQLDARVRELEALVEELR